MLSSFGLLAGAGRRPRRCPGPRPGRRRGLGRRDTCAARLPADGAVPPPAPRAGRRPRPRAGRPGPLAAGAGALARPPLRAALVEPTRVLLADGRRADVPSYTAWWLRRHAVLGGRRPADVRAADADPLLAGLYDEAVLHRRPDPALARLLADPALARALGVRTTLADLLAEPGGADELLDRLADPARPVDPAPARSLWAALAPPAAPRTRPAGPGPRRPRRRGRRGRRRGRARPGRPGPVAAGGRPAPGAGPVRAGAGLADLLDLPLASEEVPGVVESTRAPADRPRDRRRGPARRPRDLPRARPADRRRLPPSPWRYTGGAVHAAGRTASPAAWPGRRASGSARHLLAALLTDPRRPPACSPRPTWTRDRD